MYPTLNDSFIRFKNSKLFLQLEMKTHTPPPQPYSKIESKISIELCSNNSNDSLPPPDLLLSSIISSSAHEQDLLLTDHGDGLAQFDVQ